MRPTLIALSASLALTACSMNSVSTTALDALATATELKADDAIAASSVFVWRGAREGEMRDFCNGVLLADGLIATASSCVADEGASYRVSAAGAKAAEVEKIFRAAGSDVAILKVKIGTLPATLKPATLAAGTTPLSGKLHLPLYAKRGDDAAQVLLTKMSGELDLQESMPGIIAVRVLDEHVIVGGHEGSGLFVEQDGKPVLVGLVSRNSWRGMTCYTQDLRGQPLLANLTH